MSAQNTDLSACSNRKYLSVCQPWKTAWSNYLWPRRIAGVFQNHGTETGPEWMQEVHWVLSSAFQISVFSSGVSRAKQREQCLGSALPLWHSFKGPCSTDGQCLGWECMEGYSQSVSGPSFELNSVPSKHFLNTRPPLFVNFSFSASSVWHLIRVSLKCFWRKIDWTANTKVFNKCDYFQATHSWLLIYNETKITEVNTYLNISIYQ